MRSISSRADLALGAVNLALLGHARAATALRILRPLLGQEEPQRDRERDLVGSQGERDDALAVGLLAGSAGVLPSHTHGVPALLEQRDVVDDQQGIGSAEHLLGLLQQDGFEWGRIPGRAADEVVQLLVIGRGEPRRHRLDALAIPGAKQPSEVDRSPAALGFVTKDLQEGSEPLLQFTLPGRTNRALHGRTSVAGSARGPASTMHKLKVLAK